MAATTTDFWETVEDKDASNDDVIPFATKKLTRDFFICLTTSIAVDENFLISPFGILSNLGILLMNTNITSESEQKIRSVMNLNDTNKDKIMIQKEIQKIINDMKKSAASCEIENRSYIEETLSGSGSGSGSSVNVNVKKDLETYLSKMVLCEKCENENTVLVNIVYFHSFWNLAFNKNLIKVEKFWKTWNDHINVPMMYTRGDFFMKKLEHLDAKVLILPYEKKQFMMYIIRPNRVTGLYKIEQNFNKIDLSWKDFEFKRNIDLSFPKFELEYNLDFGVYIEKMGLTTCYKLIQQTQSKIGTTGITTTAINSSPVKERFSLNHPFLFFIIFKPLNVILFVGRYVTPTPKKID